MGLRPERVKQKISLGLTRNSNSIFQIFEKFSFRLKIKNWLKELKL